MKIAIVGCTGLVGSVILKVLRELKLPITSLLAVASEKSIGKEIWFNDQSIKIIGIEEALQDQIDTTHGLVPFQEDVRLHRPD